MNGELLQECKGKHKFLKKSPVIQPGISFLSRSRCVTLLPMSTTDLLALIDAEIATLKQARSLIAASAPTTAKKRPGRPAKAIAAPVTKPKPKRKMSAEA